MKLTDISRQLATAFAAVGVSSLVLVGCSNSSAPEATAEEPVTEGSTTESSATTAANDIDPDHTKIIIGTTEGDFADMVRNQVKSSLEAQGYEVELIPFTDYVRPNLALADGDLDINIFQHKPYLDTFKKENNLDLVEVFQVPTAPLGLYSGKKTSLDEVYKGMSISAPNDPSNFARALVMMSDLGWITLKDDIDPLTASKTDIADNSKYDIKIVELEAAQLPRARDEVDFAVINGNYATDAGIKLTEALFQEPSFAYINWSAVKSADVGKKWVKDVTNAYNSEAFKKYAHDTFPGYKYPKIWDPKASAATTTDAAAASTATKTTAQ
ncbi:D-methionine transport system substrate-binding protein [Psychrobacter sp. PL15]|jgi:D-methionine transport system substrate-binding protein|uniref:MetQ/NlpA family ABC transporter substrate-binding protein n=1 Tax=unclassified Psychrobacter TaxID=196806 RepID=UPI001AE44684|nr:MetQ/NlpA family ABC transporter substrate-binding protein [Psychrobacter sp. PL15]MEC5209344.1 D-methionine transport system substrate-binding protein [Psychrobacter sp. PL15]